MQEEAKGSAGKDEVAGGKRAECQLVHYQLGQSRPLKTVR